MIIVGVDPGKNGGIAVIDEFGCNLSGDVVTKISVYDMPLAGKFYDAQQVREIISDADYVFVEKQQSFPKQGVASTFTTGHGFGLIEGIIVGLGIKYEIFPARVWQKTMLVGMDRKDTKNASFVKASQLYPGVELKTKRGRILDGRSDALLIATYGKRRLSLG